MYPSCHWPSRVAAGAPPLRPEDVNGAEGRTPKAALLILLIHLWYSLCVPSWPFHVASAPYTSSRPLPIDAVLRSVGAHVAGLGMHVFSLPLWLLRMPLLAPYRIAWSAVLLGSSAVSATGLPLAIQVSRPRRRCWLPDFCSRHDGGPR